MKTFASKHTYTQNNVKKHCFARVQASNNAHIREHSPIYDIQAYNIRQRSLKRKQLIKNLCETTLFFITIVLTFSVLFWEV